MAMLPREESTGLFVGSSFSDHDYSRVRELLLVKRGMDLGMYKDPCIKRRIAARVRAHGFRQIGPYLELLEKSETEIEALVAALSIHVSQFFRNPSVFGLLEQKVIPELIAHCRQASRSELRLWSVGCAEGEEPYSLAVLLDELVPPDLEVSLLATDLSRPVLARAREGRFDAGRLKEVPAAKLNRYFRPDPGGFRLIERIRRRVTFREHNILNDPEFPRADLILCRNVLIYFNREDQDRILQKFATVLPGGGYLVLGNAENMLGHAYRFFAAEFPAERIYRRI